MITAVPNRRRCPWCRRFGILLTKKGLLWYHLRYTAAFGGGIPPVCDGAGKSPNDFTATKTHDDG